MDENPRDTVSIKFVPADARATVAKVKKPFARKIQILTVGEQRAKVMGKTQVVDIFSKVKSLLEGADRMPKDACYHKVKLVTEFFQALMPRVHCKMSKGRCRNYGTGGKKKKKKGRLRWSLEHEMESCCYSGKASSSNPNIARGSCVE